MPERGKFQYDIVKKMSFIRYGGTAEEEQAASILTEEITKMGGSYELMPFEIDACSCSVCEVSVSAPFIKPLKAIAYGCSGCIEGDYELYYLEKLSEVEKTRTKTLENKVVLLNEFNRDTYRFLCEKKAAAFLVINGKYYDSEKNSDFLPRNLRPAFLEFGKIPGFMIWAKEAMEVVRRGASRISLKLVQEEKKAVSHNILAVIPGTEYPEESIVITAHYDSVLVGTGSWDNATGSANILYLYKYFLKHPAKRTLRFIWCGSEEQGLLGSKAYISQKKELLDEIRLCYNFDMCGTILGSNLIFITGDDDLNDYVNQFCLEYGWSAEYMRIVHSSDSAPFADQGIPGIGLSRGTKSAEIHTRNDLMPTLSAAKLQDMGDFSAAFISRAANSVVLPVKKNMPDKVKEELDKYFQRDPQKKPEV